MKNQLRLWVQVANIRGGYDVYRNVWKIDANNAPEGLAYLIDSDGTHTVGLRDLMTVEPMLKGN